MASIQVTQQNHDVQGWDYNVTVEDSKSSITYNVRLDQPFYMNLTGAQLEPDALIKKSFEFLLEREPKEMILREFNLSVIQTYFNEYEETARQWANLQ